MSNEISLPELVNKFNQLDFIVESLKNEAGRLSTDDLIEFKQLINIMNQANSSKEITTKEKGDTLENAVSFLLDRIGLFTVYKNVKTSTHEIDQIFELNEKGVLFSSKNFIPIPLMGFLGECKNYNKKIPATWIGKFFSLLVNSNNKFGILFSFHKLTGNNWNDATGLTKKIYMLKENPKDKIIIVNFAYPDFKRIENGDNFFDIINEKINTLKYDTDISKYISSHPAENQIFKK